MKLTTNFRLEEFITPSLYRLYREYALKEIDERLPKIAQFIRDRYGVPGTINDWVSGGNYTLSGYRPFNSTIGAPRSQHKYGRAIDYKFLHGGPTIEEVLQDIKNHEAEFMACGITRVEEGTSTWLHLDCAYTKLDKIQYIPFY
jgi:hypothetical protein